MCEMAVEFRNEYVAGVVIFVIGIMFCKSVLECIQIAVSLCHHFDCLCDYQCRVNLHHYSKSTLLIFSMTQPIILCTVASFVYAIKGYYPVSEVDFLEMDSEFRQVRSANQSNCFQEHCASELDFRVHADNMLLSVKYVNVDTRLVVIPFSLAACVSTSAWLNLGKRGAFENDPTWDENLFEDDRIWMYEMLYYAETLGMTVAMLCCSSIPKSLSEILYTGMTVTSLMIFFASASRYQNRTQAGIFMCATTFSLLCSILASFVFTTLDTACTLPVLCGVTYICAVMGQSLFHYMAAGSCSAGAVLLVRTLSSNICLLVLIVSLGLGQQGLVSAPGVSRI